MEENKYDIDLAIINRNFNNKTMRYYINEFAKACGITDIDVEPFVEEIHEKNKYHITTDLLQRDDSDYVVYRLYGWYHDLEFSEAYLVPLMSNLNKRKYILRFGMLLKKKVGNEKYELDINVSGGIIAKYIFNFNKWSMEDKKLKDFSFCSRCVDYEKLFKLIKLFVDDPKYTYDTYNELSKKYKSRILERLDEENNVDETNRKTKKKVW